MIKRYKTISLIVAICISGVAASCIIRDSDRCGGDKDFTFTGGHCQKVNETDSVTDRDASADSSQDAGDAGQNDSSTGLGESCFDPEEDCKGYDASFCLKEPGAAVTDEGTCSIPHCTKVPDTCPDEYQCCDFISMVEGMLGVGSICVHKSIYDDVAKQAMGCDGD